MRYGQSSRGRQLLGGGRVREPQPQSRGRSERTGGYWGDVQSRQPLKGEIPTRYGQPLRVEQSSGVVDQRGLPANLRASIPEREGESRRQGDK